MVMQGRCRLHVQVHIQESTNLNLHTVIHYLTRFVRDVYLYSSSFQQLLKTYIFILHNLSVLVKQELLKFDIEIPCDNQVGGCIKVEHSDHLTIFFDPLGTDFSTK